MPKQGKNSQSKEERSAAVRAAVAPLNLSANDTERVVRHFGWAQRLAENSANQEEMNRTRKTIALLATTSMSLELTDIDTDVAVELSDLIARYLSLERTIPVTDLFLAIETAAKSMRNVLLVAGRPTNLPLLLTLQSLMPILEEMTGEPAKIRWNKASGNPPEAANSVMAVLTTLTRLIIPNATDIAIVNMIRKIRSSATSTRSKE